MATDNSQSETNSNVWVWSAVTVVVINLVLLLAALLYSWIKWKYSAASGVVYDMCKSQEGAYKYRVKVKTGPLPREIYEGTKVLVLDIHGKYGEFQSRFIIPVTECLKGQSPEKMSEVTMRFTVVRSRRFNKIGFLRIDHQMFKKEIYFHYVDIEDLNPGTRCCYRTDINSNVHMLRPGSSERYPTEQIFHSTETPGKRFDRELPATTTIELFSFLAFFLNLLLLLTIMIPHMYPSEEGQAATNGAVCGIIATVACAVIFFLYLTMRSRNLSRNNITKGLMCAVLLVSSLILAVLTVIQVRELVTKEGGWHIWMKAFGVALMFFFITIAVLFMIDWFFKKFNRARLQATQETTRAIESGNSGAIGHNTTMQELLRVSNVEITPPSLQMESLRKTKRPLTVAREVPASGVRGETQPPHV